jgi:AraC-like DNA-binding protein
MASIILVFSGSGRLLHKKTHHESLLAGGILSIPPETPCHVHSGPDLHWALLQFDPKALGVGKWAIFRAPEFAAMFPALAPGRISSRNSVRSLRLIPKHFAGAAALVGEIERELAEKRPGWRDLAAGHFQHLVILLSRHAGSEMQISTDAIGRVAKSIRHIESRYGDRICLEEVTKMCGMSQRTFYRVFRQATGQTPLSYLKNFRIERASEHLRCSENSVTEIAFACGFDDSNFFAREFHKASGYSPTEYRRHWKI